MNNLVSQLQAAMQYEEAGDLDKAHDIVLPIEHVLAYKIHAYIHHQQGQMEYAKHWYDKAGVEPFAGDCVEEREMLMQELIQLDLQ